MIGQLVAVKYAHAWDAGDETGHQSITFYESSLLVAFTEIAEMKSLVAAISYFAGISDSVTGP